MCDDPVALIDESIQQLQKLSSVLAEEVQSHPRDLQLTPGKRVRKEALLAISILLPKLRAAREVRDS